MNFVFISPNFPKQYYLFCQALKNNGVTTLGIGEDNYYALSDNCRNSLVDYYQVSSLEDYQQVFKAVATFSAKYGKIDWLESNNEYWLIQDAQLRTDFNITTGMKNDEISNIKFKSKMKEFYEKANVKTARYHLVSTIEAAKDFIDEVGYPVIVKPDNGVGASATYRLSNEDDLNQFFYFYPTVQYIMEEYINGTIISYDGICDNEGNIVFETHHIFPDSIMDIVNEKKEVYYYSVKDIPEDVKTIGRNVIKAFNVKSRFFHCEYFRLLEAKKGLGKKGDIIGLEVNMRPPGGYTPDMMNFANNISVYQIWADMITYNKGNFDPTHRPYVCVYVARRDGVPHRLSDEEVIGRYRHNICMVERMPEIFAEAMGNQMIMARFNNEMEAQEFIRTCLE